MAEYIMNLIPCICDKIPELKSREVNLGQYHVTEYFLECECGVKTIPKAMDSKEVILAQLEKIWNDGFIKEIVYGEKESD